MKDPCEECLVSVMCAQVCWDKANYDTLLENALRQNQCTNEFIKYSQKYKKHRETLNEIQSRKFIELKDL
jgi:hypothetical protein